MCVHNSRTTLPVAVFHDINVGQQQHVPTFSLPPFTKSDAKIEKKGENFIDALKYPEVWLSLPGFSRKSGRPAPASGDLLYRTSATLLRNEKSEGRNFVTLSGKIRHCVSSHERQRYAKNACVGRHDNPRND